jgi:hypothetical protein
LSNLAIVEFFYKVKQHRVNIDNTEYCSRSHQLQVLLSPTAHLHTARNIKQIYWLRLTMTLGKSQKWWNINLYWDRFELQYNAFQWMSYTNLCWTTVKFNIKPFKITLILLQHCMSMAPKSYKYIQNYLIVTPFHCTKYCSLGESQLWYLCDIWLHYGFLWFTQTYHSKLLSLWPPYN